MSIRYTSGSVGRFTFTQANRLSDAADAIESRQFEAPQVERRGAKPIVAVLTSRASGSWFGAGSNTREVWNWSEAGVVLVGGSRRVSAYPDGMKSVEFGEMPNGRAVMLSGTAKPGDIVTLFPLLDDTQEPWYAFVGRQVVTGQTSMLRLTGYQDLGEGWYTYQVQPIYWPDDDRTDMPSGIGYNLYERSDRHGQRLTFNNPDARLMVEGPVQGPVFGVIASAPLVTPVVWVFDVANPLTVECLTDVPQLIEQTLRNGI
jgi:hypothetical protein